MLFLRLFLNLIFAVFPCFCLDNALARTPPMGWMVWERYRCNTDCDDTLFNGCINETLFMRMAEKMVADGYKAAGYEYVNIDDCWSLKHRDRHGNLQADPKRFPSGMKALAKYIHDLGLKLGIYADFGTKTCAEYPGSMQYLQRDVNTFASWDVDYLKLDVCYGETADMNEGFPLLSQYLNETGRHILFSCEWPWHLKKSNLIIPYAKIAKYCNTWRNYYDVQDSWASVSDIIDYYGKDEGSFRKNAGPGHFNDPDMLVVGDFGLSYEQQRAQMALWAILAAPLFMSVDLYDISEESRALLLNERVIAISQDRLGLQGSRVKTMDKLSFWTRPLEPIGTWAIAVLNTLDKSLRKVTMTLSDVKVQGKTKYRLIEVFNGEFMGIYTPRCNITFVVKPLGVFLMKAVPLKSVLYTDKDGN